MDFYFLAPNGQLHLPVNPSEVTITRERGIETVDIINLGEVDFPAGEKVKEIAFSSFFPAEYDPSYCRYADLPDPQEAMNWLNSWMAAKKPVRLLITETAVNILVLIARHTSYFRGGEPGDVYFDLTCRTWRDVKVKTLQPPAAKGANQPRPRPDVKPVPKVYVVKKGDNLWKIAKLQLGSGARWKEIYNLNRKVIGADPDKLHPGQRLVMPA